MAIKKYKPTTPGRRGMTGLTFDEVTKSKALKQIELKLLMASFGLISQ